MSSSHSGEIEIAPEFETTLRASGLRTFEDVMALPVEKGNVTRWFPGRLTARLSLGEGKTAYLKRYEKAYLSPKRFFLRAVGWPNARDEAEQEWTMLTTLSGLNIPAPIPIAVGREKVAGIVVRSFVMTEEIYGGIQGDHYCQGLSAGERRKFALELADFSRRFHETGYVHKDFYLCHFFVVSTEKERRFVLIDFQRAARPQIFRERWLVKDLGGLAFSALEVGFSTRDLLAFFRVYQQKKRLDAADKKLIRKIIARVRRFQRHQPKNPNRPPPGQD